MKGGDVVEAHGNPVELSGLQGGVPFADISVSGGDIVGQELTVEVSGKNLFNYRIGGVPNGITLTDNDGCIHVSGKMERETAWGINLIIKNHYLREKHIL